MTYHNQLGMKYFAYPVKSGSADMIQFVNQWIQLKTQSGFTQTQIDYWIKGKPLPSKQQF
jgi:hypothetical protein